MSYLKKAIDIFAQATEEDMKRHFPDALRLYEEGIVYFIRALKYEAHSDKAKSSIKDKCEQFLTRAEKIKTFLNQKSDGKQSEGEVLEKKLLRASSSVESPSVGMTDVIGLDSAKDVLEEAFVLPEKFPHMFKGMRKPSHSVLLYGPPGTGKTLLVQFVGSASKSTVYTLSMPYVVSHWTGESENMVEEFFSQARRNTPSIVCLEEVEVLCESDRLKAEFLSYIDRLKHDNWPVRILATSSQPWKMDSALMSRFEKIISIPLPDVKARTRMFQHHIGDTPHSVSAENFLEYAEKTEGYSGRDIHQIVRAALMTPVKEVQAATHFKKVRGPSRADRNVMEDDLLTPCSPGAPGAIEMSWTDVPGNKLLEPVVSRAHMLKALAESKPSTNKDQIELYERFTRDME